MAGASGRPASILLIDDHAAIGAAMVVALQSEGFDPVVAVDAEDLSVEAVLGAARSMNPDIVLLDVNLGRGRAGLPMITPLTQLGVRVLLFTASSDPTTVAAGLRLGAAAVLDKAMSFQKVVGALREVAAGRELIPRDEREALIEALERHMEEEHSRLRGFEALTEREAQVLRRLCRLEDLPARGKLGEVLAAWNGDGLAEGVAEMRVVRGLLAAGLPQPVRQYEIWVNGVLIARVDLAYLPFRLAMELDGFRWHAGRRKFRSDRMRRNRVEAAGWRLVEAAPDDIDDLVAGAAAIVQRAA